jgi:hypothetical protein
MSQAMFLLARGDNRIGWVEFETGQISLTFYKNQVESDRVGLGRSIWMLALFISLINFN